METAAKTWQRRDWWETDVLGRGYKANETPLHTRQAEDMMTMEQDGRHNKKTTEHHYSESTTPVCPLNDTGTWVSLNV